MFDSAVVAIKANKAAALGEFNDKNNKQFHDRDLYVFCYNMSDGKFTAHTNSAVMGTDVRTQRYKDDAFGQRGYNALTGSPEGTVTMWITTSRSLERASLCQNNPLPCASVIRAVALATTNSRFAPSTDHLVSLPTPSRKHSV
jgi:hypothetical protein